jgi:DNA-binding winged helix-turn-helix (wHTH) protein
MMIKKNRFSIVLLAIVIFALLSFSLSNQEDKNFSERVKIILRAIGNQLLLSNKDSISIILPVVKVSEYTFKLSFKNKVSLEPSNLVLIVKNSFEKVSFSKNYIVEVFRCLDNEVAYSYEINELEEKTIIPCAGRVLPKNYYTIQVKFLNLNSSNSWLYYLFILIILGVIYKLFLIENKEKIIENKITETPSKFGSFQFYPNQNILIKEANKIALSKKECELLEIFVANPNRIIKREELTKKVWEDKGVFVGRSLDTYISKLRKKLKEDSAVKLINIHGVGYKLEIK